MAYRSKGFGRGKEEEITGAEAEKKTKKTRRTAKDEALYFLEFRARTLKEVERRLQEKEYTEEERRECLDFLIECHFVDDLDYCFRYVEHSIEKGRGPGRIRQELAQKGVSGEIIGQGLGELYDLKRQKETALIQAAKALNLRDMSGGQVREADLTEKELAKAARRLAAQGFSSSVVYEVLGRLKKDGSHVY